MDKLSQLFLFIYGKKILVHLWFRKYNEIDKFVKCKEKRGKHFETDDYPAW